MEENKTKFVSITETTAFGARDRVLNYLDKLTSGNAYKAIECVVEYLELNKICEEFEKEEIEKEEPCGYSDTKNKILNDFYKGTH